MSLALPFGLKLVNPVPVDAYYYSTGGTPYTSVAQVNAQILGVIRYRGLTVNINNVEYWYKDGIADVNLIIKSGGSAFDITGYTATTEIRLQGIEADIDYISGVTDTNSTDIDVIETNIVDIYLTFDSKQNLLTAGNGISSSDLALDTVSVELSGYTAQSSINITISGGTSDFKVFDNSTVKRGVEYGGNYHPTYSNRSLVDKEYVDILAGGLTPKNSVNVSTTIADGNLAVTGVTQLALPSGMLDGIPVLNGWRVLVKNQTNAALNGIYTYNIGNQYLTRASDFDNVGEMSSGSFTTVIFGNTLSNTVWIVTSLSVVTVGVEPVDWSIFSLPVAGIATIQNIGSGAGILSGITGNVADLRSLVAGAGVTITENNDEIEIAALASGSGERIEKEFIQSGHTFSVGDVVEYSGSTFIKALALEGRNSEVIGWVSEIPDANSFKVVINGYVDGISALTLSPTTTYYLSDTIAGGVISVSPTNPNTISKPILTTLTNNDAIIFQYRGIINISGITSSGQEIIYTGSTPASINLGGITIGYQLTGKTANQILENLLVPTLNPTLTAPSITSFTQSLSTTQEVGVSVTPSFTTNFSRGSKVPQYSSVDAFRSGLPTAYEYSGSGNLRNVPSSSTSNTSAATGATTLIEGTNTWSVFVKYDIGTQPKNSAGGDFSTPLASGSTSTSNVSITGRFLRFFGSTVANPTNSATTRALPTSALQTANVNTFTLNTGNSLIKFAVALPPSRTITSVFDIDAGNANITSSYVLVGTVSVNDGGGSGTPRTYNLYILDIGSPYSSNHQHSITTG